MVNRACGIISTNYSREDFSLLTANRPIASIPFGARYRLVDFPLSNMVNSKITSVGLITPHLYRSIIDHVGSGKEWGLSIKNGGLFILPGTTYGFDIGKGKIFLRDIKNNSQFLTKTREEYVVLSASNKIYNIDYNEALDFHIKNGASVTLIYKKMEVESVGDMSIDLNGDKVVGIGPAKKKMSNLFIDTLIMDKEIIFKLLSWYADRSYLDLIDVINENLSHLKVYAYEFKGYVAPVNNLEDYMKASRDLFKQDVMKELLFGERRILTKIHDAPPVKYGENAKVSSSIIGTGTKVLGEVKNSIVFRASIIEEDVKLNNCVIMQGAVIKKGAKLTNVILEKYAIVGEGADYHGSEKKPLIITRMQN